MKGNKNDDYDVVMAKITSTTPNPTPDAEKGIPMWGELSGYKTISYGSELGSITLYRALARVDVFMYKLPIPGNGVPETDWDAAVAANNLDNFNLGNFKIEKVRIYNAPSEFRLAPIISNFDFTDENNSTPSLPNVNSGRKLVEQGTITPHSDGSGVGVVRGLYMGEADVLMSSESLKGTYADANHLERPCIIVQGIYKGNLVVPSFYRIDFLREKDPITKEMELHNILRNSNYQVIITSVSGPGKPSAEEALKSMNADMTVVVKTWNDAGQGATTVDGQNWLHVDRRDIETDKWMKTDEELEITTNIPVVNGKSWSATVTEGGDWLTLSGGTTITGVSGGKLMFNISQISDALTQRTGKITITAGAMSLAVLVKQTKLDGDFMLRISQASFTFPGRVSDGAGGWRAPDPQTLTVNWAPRINDFGMELVSYTGGGVQGFTPASTSNTPTVSIGLDMIDPDNARVQENPFFERSSLLTVTAWDLMGTTTITKQVAIKQVFYSLVATGMEDYYFQGKSYTLNVKCNTDWAVEVLNGVNANIFTANPATTGAANTVAGKNIPFTIATNATPNATATLRFYSPQNLFPEQLIDIVPQDEQPNCYIVAPNGTLQIPVNKAYRVWKYDHDLKGLHPNGDLPTGGKSAVLLWQDNTDVIQNVSFSSAPNPGVINITTGTQSGNAVVAFQIDGTTYWSWHIWVTAENPATNPAYQVTTSDGVIFMDRNLGARGNSGYDSYGLHYQGQRKDPFPPVSTLTDNTPRTIYDVNNVVTTTTTETASGSGGLPLAIKKPMAFIKGLSGNTNWYGIFETTRPGMWRKKGIKMDYEPCPTGWRVAQYREGGLVSTTTPVPTGTDVRFIFNGLDFPLQGNYSYTTGALQSNPVALILYMLNGELPTTLEVVINRLSGNTTNGRQSTGGVVRCVKE